MKAARAAVLALLAGAAIAVPASPVSAAACPTSAAVTVVVDFASLGGGEQTRCTGVDPPSGLAALRDAGFTPTRAAQEPGYFVCRIDGKPANDPCQRTPPADAYWSYWHAKRGGTWAYSSLGPADRDPPAGSVEGWAFGAGKPPSTPPPATSAPAPSPSPAASTARPLVAASPTTVRSTPARATRSAPPLSSPAAVTARLAPAAPPSTSPPEAGPAAAAISQRRVVGKTEPIRPHRVPTGPIAALGLVLLLLAGTARHVVVRRRRGEA